MCAIMFAPGGIVPFDSEPFAVLVGYSTNVADGTYMLFQTEALAYVWAHCYYDLVFLVICWRVGDISLCTSKFFYRPLRLGVVCADASRTSELSMPLVVSNHVTSRLCTTSLTIWISAIDIQPCFVLRNLCVRVCPAMRRRKKQHSTCASTQYRSTSGPILKGRRYSPGRCPD